MVWFNYMFTSPYCHLNIIELTSFFSDNHGFYCFSLLDIVSGLHAIKKNSSAFLLFLTITQPFPNFFPFLFLKPHTLSSLPLSLNPCFDKPLVISLVFNQYLWHEKCNADFVAYSSSLILFTLLMNGQKSFYHIVLAVEGHHMRMMFITLGSYCLNHLLDP